MSWFRRDESRRLWLLGGGGCLLVVGLVTVLAQAGVTQDVTLPHWWGPWPRREPGDLGGWVAAGVLLLGAFCALWSWLGARVLRGGDPARPPTTGLRGEQDRAATRCRGLMALSVTWSLPLLITAPLGSLDVQSYAAVGRLAALGFDPYQATPDWLYDAYGAAVDPMWRETPTPYGPLQVTLLRLLVSLAGTHVTAAVLLIRTAAILGLGCAVVLAVLNTAPPDRPAVLLLTAVNPLLIVHVVSGAHLDVLVGAMAVLVVALVLRGQPAVAMAVAVVAAMVKLPGVLLVGFVVLYVARRTPQPRRAQALLAATTGGATVLGLIAALHPDPFGWVGALGVPGMSRNGTAPSSWLSYLIGALTGHLSGHGLDQAFTLGRAVTAVAGAVVAGALLWRSTSGSQSAVFRDVGFALIAVALSGPALYPWYLAWGLFAAAIGSGLRGRLLLMWLSSALSLSVALSSAPLALASWLVVVLAVLGYTGRLGRRLVTESQGSPLRQPVLQGAVSGSAERAGAALHGSVGREATLQRNDRSSGWRPAAGS